MDLIPIIYKDSTASFSLQGTLFDQGENVDVTILTKTGELIEIGSRVIKNTLKLDFHAEDVQLLTFYSYNPLTKYYIVKCGEKVIIVLKDSVLKIFKEFEGVSSIKISDCFSIGKPLVIIELKNEEQVITDFQGTYPIGDHFEKEKPIFVKDTLPTVNTQIQKLNLCLKKAEIVLRDKRNLSTKFLFKLDSYSEIEETVPEEVDNLVYVIGEKIPKELKNFTVDKSEKIKLDKHWHKYINTFILLGFYITNTHARDIKDIELILDAPGGAVCNSRLFVLKGRGREGGGEWAPAPSNTLPANSSGAITGWLSDSCLISPVIKISGTLVYPVDSDRKDLKQVLLDPVLLNISDISSGKLLVSETESSEEDLLSIMSVSVEVRLSVKLTLHQPDVCEVLQTFGFLQHLPGYLVYPASSQRPFRGLLIRVVDPPLVRTSSKTQDIIIYARDASQLSLFLLSFESLFPKGSRVVAVGGEVGPALEAVRREVDSLLRQLLPCAAPRLPLAATSTADVDSPLLLQSISHFERESNTFIACLKAAHSSNKAQSTQQESPKEPTTPFDTYFQHV